MITDGAIGELRDRLAGRFQRDVLINSVVDGRRQVEQDEYADRLEVALGEVGWTTTSIVSVGGRAEDTVVLTGTTDAAADVLVGWLVGLGLAATRSIDRSPSAQVQITIGRASARWPWQAPPSVVDAHPAPEPPTPAGEASPGDQVNDENARQRLLARIGEINDFSRPRPLLMVEEFFEGNADPASIGYNLGGGGPGPRVFYDVLRRIRERADVADVLVEVKDLEEPDGWPSTDTVYVITGASAAEVRSWLPPHLAPDTCRDHAALGPPATEAYEVPPGHQVVALWWD